MPHLSNTFIIGAAQFVVHDAFEIITSSFVSVLSLTPITIVLMSLSFGGADIKTFFAPASKCFCADALSKKKPVLSSTTSTSNSFQDNLAGSALAVIFIFWLLIIIYSPS